MLEVNGKGSIPKQTKRIKVTFIFTKDKVESRDASVKYCPMDRAWAEILAKPLLGTKYKVFQENSCAFQLHTMTKTHRRWIQKMWPNK